VWWQRVAATPDTASAEYMCARLRRLKQTHDLLKGCCSIPPLLLSWQPLSSCTEPLSSAAESRPSQKCEKSSPSTTMSFLTSPRSLCLFFPFCLCLIAGALSLGLPGRVCTHVLANSSPLCVGTPSVSHLRDMRGFPLSLGAVKSLHILRHSLRGVGGTGGGEERGGGGGEG